MISIIIPALNEEKTIEETLRQFEALSLPHEIIVADGGSTDKTADISRKLADKVAVQQEVPRPSIAKNRNNGANLAEGEYLVFVDAGVLIPGVDKFFNRALSHFETNPKLVGLTSQIRVFPEAESFMDRLVFGIMNFNFLILNNFLHIGIAQGKFQMVRKNAFEKIGGFREDLAAAEDQVFFYNLSKIGRTMIDFGLKVYHSGRRAHAIGWPKLLLIWWRDSLWLLLFDRTYSKNWEQAKPRQK
jgi:glycosyltransferase involved in cell wall biosynthesis